jgi:hypothetical protein
LVKGCRSKCLQHFVFSVVTSISVTLRAYVEGLKRSQITGTLFYLYVWGVKLPYTQKKPAPE